MKFCTVVARNYLAYARVLAQSLHEVYDDADISVLVVLMPVIVKRWFPDRVAVSPDGRWAGGLRKNRLAVWSLAELSGPPALLTNDSHHSFTDLAFHPSGRFLAVMSPPCSSAMRRAMGRPRPVPVSWVEK